MHTLRKYLFIQFLCLIAMASCDKPKTESAIFGSKEDSISTFTLDDILQGGELIMLTLSGPDTYFDYHNHGLGVQYLLCEDFAIKMGVSVRVDVCQDTTELYTRLRAGEGDVIAMPLADAEKDVIYCGVKDSVSGKRWVVNSTNEELADELNAWFKPELIREMTQKQQLALSTNSVRRHVYSPMLDSRRGIISSYDGYFRKYAQQNHLDWRLVAAQAYQESTFDPNARSWAGACGLMQIMPSTATHLGLAHEDIYDPELNIKAACKYLAELERLFADVPVATERTKFVLASYNGGATHIRDAMALCHRDGKSKYSWKSVSEYVLKLSTEEYYRDPIVKAGYMRGSETVDYVDKILTRWQQYRMIK